jgi:hypothetical protein
MKPFWVFLVIVTVVGCNTGDRAQISVEQARAKADSIFQSWNTETRAEESGGDTFEVMDIADIDGDGIYEVAAKQNISGSGGYFGGSIFRLEADSLVFLEASDPLYMMQGDVRLRKGGLVLAHPYWGSNDAHCCPSYEIRAQYSYNKSKGFVLVSEDTGAAPKR